jgi:hypothetical protein
MTAMDRARFRASVNITKRASRVFARDAKRESRVHCRCELCRLRFGRMLYPVVGGEPLKWGRLPGFTGNFSPRWVLARQRNWRLYRRQL